MPASESTSSAIAKLEKLAADARNTEWLATALAKPGLAKMWLGRVRLVLVEIYGIESDVVRRFPDISIPVSASGGKAAARASLTSGVSEVERLLEALHGTREAAVERVPKQQDLIFIGHGGSKEWLVLSKFLTERLALKVQELNSESVAGVGTQDRLMELLDQARFAFLVMTAEDEHADSSRHARENVVHEVGLFQGRLGLKRAIVLLENGCHEFSNIHGLGQIRFPKGDIEAAFEKVRLVLEREKIIATSGSTAKPAGLSSEARTLLAQAALGDGTILDFSTVVGRFIQANGTTFGDPEHPRATAKWVAGLKQLIQAELVEDVSGKGEVYQVTEPGYQIEERM